MMNDVQKNNKKQLSGKVLESKMKDTAVVRVVRKFPHPKYKKFINKSKKYYAHDPKNICKSVLVNGAFSLTINPLSATTAL